MGQSRGLYRVLLGNPEGKRPLGRPRDEDFFSCSVVLLPGSVRSSSSSAWEERSASCITGAVIASTLESASATMFSWPDIWRMSVVNWEMKSRCFNWRCEHLSLFLWKAKINDLCCVGMVKCRASSM